MSLENIQIVNWPNESKEYKVVQLELDSKPYLRFSTSNIPLHRSVLIEFLKSNNVKHSEIEGPCNMPVPKGDRYKVHGMGKSEVDIKKKIATFYGSSSDYDIGINPEHLELTKKSVQLMLLLMK